ncbi:hypothetical protein [Rhodobacter ferrooxidans]|uniref:Uncharacterized protein n=1 Tax=Rhodobacter ferrooxidans TaxID=371731 RepID=C8S4R2_9RHOB|nr:hypothetical protein [Rhodobacter sp. SW2]EEW24061.1 hypothetical protein Rsw2DRAFT_3040 [Rhodobacter sp. SW2]
MGWILSALTTSRWARAAAIYAAAALTLVLFLLNLRRAGERAGRLAERLQTKENAHAAQRQMLEAASRRPRDADALAQRMRDGRF